MPRASIVHPGIAKLIRNAISHEEEIDQLLKDLPHSETEHSKSSKPISTTKKVIN